MSKQSEATVGVIDYLDAKVHADGAAAGFDGVICVGVKNGTSTTWWVAECSRSKPTRTHKPEAPGRYDVGVGLDQPTAGWILGARRTPGEVHVITKDVRLWRRFLERYLKSRGVVGARLWR